MSWYLRLVWWLLLAMLLEFAWTPVEADVRSGSREKRNLGRKSEKDHTDTATAKPNAYRYGYKAKPTPRTKHTIRQRSTKVSRKSTTGASYWHHDSTPATPIDTANTRWGGNDHNSRVNSAVPNQRQQPSFDNKPRCARGARLKCAKGGWSQPRPAPDDDNTSKTVQTTLDPTTETKSPFTEENSAGSPESPHGVWPPTTTVANYENVSKTFQTTQRTVVHTTSPVTEKNYTGLHDNSDGAQPPLPASKTSATERKTSPPLSRLGDTTPANILDEGSLVNGPAHPQTYLGYAWSHSHQTSSGPQWTPPGYVPITSIIPGLTDSPTGGDDLGYSKNFTRPSSPTIILQIPNYHYPSSIPSKVTRNCECYVKGLTAACVSKLKDKRIPSCVNSSVTALFIKSEEVDELSIEAIRNVPHLKSINITDTKLTSLPRDFFRDTKQLLHLVVQKNPKLKSLHPDVFRDAYELEDVILDRNSISSLDRDVFTNLTSVKRLNLGYNKIRSLPKGIFRDNRELEELRLSGNPLHISSDTARDLLRSNAKLRVLLMSSCELDELPTGLLQNASNLEWLDLSHNNISRFPAQFIRDCTKLGYLQLSYNQLTVLGSDMLHQHGGSLATLRLDGNPWRCDCDLAPLASWAALRRESGPSCGSPLSVRNEPLQRWVHTRDAEECGGAASSLRTDLNRVMYVACTIAVEGPEFTNFLNISDKEVSFAATNYFLHAMAVRTDTDVGSIVRRWARFLQEFLNRRDLRYSDAEAKTGTNYTLVDWSAPTLENVSEENVHFKLYTRMGPLATTTTKLPASGDLHLLARPKGFEPLVNFTYFNVPENMIKIVDDGIEEELKALFGVIERTSDTSVSDSTGRITNAEQNTSYVTLAPSLQKSTVSTAAPTNQAPDITSTFLPPAPFSLLLNVMSVLAISTTTLPTANYSRGTPVNAFLNTATHTNNTSTANQNITNNTHPSTLSTLLSNMPSVVATSATTSLPANASGVIPVNAFLNSTTLTDSTSPADQNISNSTYVLPSFNATTAPASGISMPFMNPNSTEVVARLRFELREVLSILLQSIDRASSDAAYHKYVEEEEKEVLTSPRPLHVSKAQKTTSANSSAGSYVSVQPQLTVHVCFFTLLASTLV